MRFIDSHVHLDAPDYALDVEEVISHANQAGVTELISIGSGYGSGSHERAVAIAERFAGVWATIGVHPLQADEPPDEAALETLALHSKVCAIGETGLDFVKEYSSRTAQYRWFEWQIDLARRVKKPLVVHSRGAAEECFEVLKTANAEEVGGVFHCFAEDAAFAERLVDLNFYVSFGGVVTFKNAHAAHKAAAEIPLDRILLETDGPFLAPVPHRGKRCESSYVPLIAAQIATLRGIDIEEVAAKTFSNTCRLFGLPLL